MGSSLRNISAIAGKELRSFYSSPIAWVMLGLFAAIFGYFFGAALTYFAKASMAGQMGGGPQKVNVNLEMIRPLLSNTTVLILFLLPMVTMRTYSEEKRSGTIELLLTSPLKDVEIILGKFLGAMGMYLGLLGVTAVYMSIVFIYGNPAIKPLLSGYLGLLLFGGGFVAVGLFISSLTGNQMVAGAASFVVFLLFWIISWLGESMGPTMASIMSYLSITEHFDDFGKGIIDTKHIVFYLSFIALGLFLATKSVDSDQVEGLTVKRALAILGWVGFALVAAAVILRFTKPDWPGATQNLAIAGLVVTVIYALSQWRDIGRSFEGRNVRYGSIAAGSVLVFVAILVAVNWLASRQNKRWDLTESKQFSLSDQTRQILANLKSPLKVHVFHGSQDNPQRFRDRFTEYEYLSKQISVEYVNAEGKPAEAEKFEITAVPTIVMEYGGRTQRATSVDESAITNALKKLIEGKTKKAYFLQGHGERDTDDASTPKGFKAAASALADENFESAKLALAQAGSIPADATLLIIAGATTDLLPQEAELIGTFLKDGGKLLLLIDPQDKDGKGQPPSLIALAKAWGIQVNDDIVVDPSPIGRTIGTDASVPIGMPTAHPITANFRVITAFPLTQSVTAVEGGTDGKFAQSFVQTGEQSWAEADVKGLYTTQSPKKDTDKGDKAGPISVAAAVSAPAAAAPPPPATDKPATDKPEDAPKPESRLAVIGDSDFASNRWLALGGNSDLFLNTANWLAQQEDLIAIRPRDPEDRRVELTEDQQTRILWITLVIIPLALFANAFRVYWKRR